MISWINEQLKNIVNFQISDRQHNKWIRLINKYYKNMLNDSENADIYLNRLLNFGDINQDDEKYLSENKIDKDVEYDGSGNDYFEYRYNIFIKEEEPDFDFFEKIKIIFKECLKELEKYGNNLIHRKF
jgi:hypothetical protein